MDNRRFSRKSRPETVEKHVDNVDYFHSGSRPEAASRCGSQAAREKITRMVFQKRAKHGMI